MRTDVRGADSGPLAGRTLAVKDNIEVAGVPMRNGPHTLEGFVPRRDATVVSRLLEAGATCLRVAPAFEQLVGGFPPPSRS